MLILTRDETNIITTRYRSSITKMLRSISFNWAIIVRMLLVFNLAVIKAHFIIKVLY